MKLPVRPSLTLCPPLPATVNILTHGNPREDTYDVAGLNNVHQISRRDGMDIQHFLNPLTHGQFSDPYFKVLREGGKIKFLDFPQQKGLQGQEFSSMGASR